MAVNVDAVGEKIFNLMKGFGLEVKSFNTDGKISINPQEATRFVVAEPNMIVRYDKPNQTIQFATSTTESTEQLRLMLKDLATDNLQNFDFKVFDRKLEPKSEKIDIAQKQETDMADVLEGFGAMTGSTKTSYQGLENVKIVNVDWIERRLRHGVEDGVGVFKTKYINKELVFKSGAK